MKKNKNEDSWSHKNDYPIEEIWNTYTMIARDIVPRLRAFKAIDKHGYPGDMKDMSQWNNTIQKMIDAFELMQDSFSSTAENQTTISEGLELFCRYYRNLWD